MATRVMAIKARVVAILETMWDWRGMTSGAGYAEAPRYFNISPQNFTGRRLYKLIGDDAKLLCTESCRELACGPDHHGKPDPAWLGENLRILDGVIGRLPNSAIVPHGNSHIDVLLVCGKVAQRTYEMCDYAPRTARVIEIPHPAARGVWNKRFLAETQRDIQREVYDSIAQRNQALIQVHPQ